jgi:phenylacetate-CoA ligase
MLGESQWWPAEKLHAWQRQHLRLLLNHARESSPFYKFRLNKVFLPSGDIDWDRWHEIPIVTRGDVLKQHEALLSRSPIPGHGPFQDVQSSGSTGHPVTVRVTGWLMNMTAACNWRAQQWAGLDWSKGILSTEAMDAQREEGENMGTWGPPWLAETQHGRRIYSHYGTEHDLRLKLMRDQSASYHASSAFSAGMTAERALETGFEVQLDAVLARGGAVTDQLRSVIHRAFGCKVVELYSSKECGAIAHPCPDGEGYHINAESLLLEVVDERGWPVAPGQSGRAVVTPFASTGMPLIRYDQGDIVVAGNRCSCGRCLPSIASISGRERASFIHPDGRKINRDLPFESYQLIGAGQVQVAQVGPTDYQVRYTPRNWNVPRDEAAFIKTFRELYFDDANLTFVELAEILPTPAGKFMANVVEWDRGE